MNIICTAESPKDLFINARLFGEMVASEKNKKSCGPKVYL